MSFAFAWIDGPPDASPQEISYHRHLIEGQSILDQMQMLVGSCAFAKIALVQSCGTS